MLFLLCLLVCLFACCLLLVACLLDFTRRPSKLRLLFLAFFPPSLSIISSTNFFGGFRHFPIGLQSCTLNGVIVGELDSTLTNSPGWTFLSRRKCLCYFSLRFANVFDSCTCNSSCNKTQTNAFLQSPNPAWSRHGATTAHAQPAAAVACSSKLVTLSAPRAMAAATVRNSRAPCPATRMRAAAMPTALLTAAARAPSVPLTQPVAAVLQPHP